MTFFSSMFGGFDILIKNFKTFLLLALPVSLFLAIIYYCLGQDIFCINSLYVETHYCSQSFWAFALSRFAQGLVMIIFMRVWYRNALFVKQQFSYKEFIPQKVDLKTFGLFLGLFATILVSMLSAYLLYAREPNPNWQIEALYFTIVSLGFIIPLLALRFLSFFAFNFEDEKFPSIKEMWHKSSGLTMKIFTGFVFYLFVSLLIINIFFQNVVFSGNGDNYFITFLSEYISSLISLIMIAVFTNIAYLQKQILFERS